MEMGVRKLPKKRKFDPSELEENNLQAVCIPVSVVQCTSVMSAPQATAVDYSCSQRIITQEDGIFKQTSSKQNIIDLSEWCDHRVLAKQGDWYYPGVIREASGSNVSRPLFPPFLHACICIYICIHLPTLQIIAFGAFSSWTFKIHADYIYIFQYYYIYLLSIIYYCHSLIFKFLD